MRNIIKEIWEIRKLVDDAVDNKDQEMFNMARERLNNIITSGQHLKTVATSSISFEPENTDEMLFDREQNFAMIAFDFGQNSRRVKGEEIPIEQFQFSSALEVVWYTSWMFNNFVKNAQSQCDISVNMDILSAIRTNLQGLFEYYNNFKDDKSIKEKLALLRILKKVNITYCELYDQDKNINM